LDRHRGESVDSWAAVEAEINRIASQSVDEPFDPDTLANVRKFLEFASKHCPVPEVGKGYGSTVRFSWKATPPIEVEVFGDRLEIYRFYDGRTDIRQVGCSAGGDLPQELVADLPSRV
jgi:hypothetical protein